MPSRLAIRIARAGHLAMAQQHRVDVLDDKGNYVLAEVYPRVINNERTFSVVRVYRPVKPAKE